MSGFGSELESAHALVQLRRLVADQCSDGHAQRLAIFEQLALQISRLAQGITHLEIHTIGQSCHQIAAFWAELDVELFQHNRKGANDRVRYGPIVKRDRYRPQTTL